MAEAIAAVGLASAILSLVEFGAKVVKRLDEFKTNVQDLPQSFFHISCQLPLLVDVANRLHDQTCQNELDPKTKNALIPVVEGLHEEIRKLDAILLKVLPAAQASTWKKGVMAVKSLAVQKSVDDFAAVIQDYVINLTAFQATHNAAVIRSLVQLITDQTSKNPASGPQKSRKPAWMVNFDSDEHFVGRGEIIEAIEGQFRDEKSRVVLTGIGGVGKSRIAIQYCYRYRQQIAENDVFWVHGASKARFETAYQQIAGRLDLPGRQDREIDHLRLVSDWLSDEEHGSWLIVLDNADDRDLWLGPSARNSPNEERPKPLIDYLPRGHHGRILITSRDNQLGYRLVEGKHDPIKVTRLGPIEARLLLQSKLLDGNELGDEDADELTAALEYLPLTITQAAAYLKEIGEPVTEYLQLLRAGRSDIPEILNESVDDPGRDREDREASNSVFQTWRISFDQILRQSPRAANTLSLMAMLDRQAISLELLQRPEDTERPLELKAAISKLKAFAFITEENVPSTYSLHRLVQISTQRWLDHHNRLLTWQEAAVSAVAEKYPSTVEYKSWPLLNHLNSHAQAVLEYKISAKPCQIHRATILHTLGHYHLDQGLDSPALKLLDKCCTLRRDHLGPEHEDTLTSMGLLRVAYNKKNKWEDARRIHLKVLEVAERVFPNHRITLKGYSRLAMTYMKLGQVQQGLERQKRALKLMKQHLGPENPDTLTEMTNLAFSYHRLKDWKEAEKLELDALHLRQKVLGKSHPDTLTVRANLALTYGAQQRWEEAKQLDEQTLFQRRQILGPDHPRTVRTMQHLAQCYYRQGSLTKAKSLAEEALEKLQQRHGKVHDDIVRATEQLREIEAAEAQHGNASQQQQLQLLNALSGPRAKGAKYGHHNSLYQRREGAEASHGVGEVQQEEFPPLNAPSKARAKGEEYGHHNSLYQRTEEAEASHGNGEVQQQQFQIPSRPSRPRARVNEYNCHARQHSDLSSNRESKRGRTFSRSVSGNKDRESDWRINSDWRRRDDSQT